MSNQAINTRDFSNIDFDVQRQKLVDFLATKTEFQDFNFEGPAISILLDALTFSNIQLSTYANFSLSEVFLDSAQIRGSVVSRAKELGYIPRSASSAYAQLKVTINLGSANTGITNFYIPAYTKFAANINNKAFTFYTTDRYQLTEQMDSLGVTINPGVYSANIVVNEGLLSQQSFTFGSDTLEQLFTLTNQQIDTQHLVVTTSEANSTNVTTWNLSTNIVKVDSTSNVYFIQEGPDGFWQLYFGDGIIGATPTVGSTVKIQFLATQGAAANGINVFGLVDTLTYTSPTSNTPVSVPGTSFTVTTVVSSAYGADRESIDSIRESAPKAYKAQNRAVTTEDFISILQNQYGYIQTAAVWGGQDNDPPYYGRIYISIKPKYGNYLSPLTKQGIEDNLTNNYCVTGLTPVVVDPDYTFAYITSNVAYDSNATSLTAGDISNLVENEINSFFSSNVSFFNRTFRKSKLLAAIDDIDSSILGNDTKIQLAKQFTPTPGILQSWKFNFYNPIEPGTVTTNTFLASSGQYTTLKDSGTGSLDQYVGGVLVSTGAGTIDYTNGIITMNSFTFNVPANTQIVMYANSTNSDLSTARNNLIVVENITINVNNG